MLTEEQKRDYPELEGKEIIYKGTNGDVPALVIGCNYHIGVTIVAKKNLKKYLNCALGPLAPNAKEAYKRGREDIDEWDEIFASKLAMIKQGVVTRPKRAGLHNDNNSLASSCPFGQ